MGYWEFILWYAGPFVAASILLLAFAYITHRIRLKNAEFDRKMTVWVPHVFNRKVGQTVVIIVVVVVCIIAWSSGWGGYYE